jgi:hypothetical protein
VYWVTSLYKVSHKELAEPSDNECDLVGDEPPARVI